MSQTIPAREAERMMKLQDVILKAMAGRIFTIQTERVVDKDNAVATGDRWWQIEKCRWRHTLAGQTVTIHEHLDGTVSIRYGPHVVGRYDTEGRGKAGSVEAVENQKHVSHRPSEIAAGDSRFSTAWTIRPLPPDAKAKRVSIKPDNYKS
jgi:hypothetical protein